MRYGNMAMPIILCWRNYMSLLVKIYIFILLHYKSFKLLLVLISRWDRIGCSPRLRGPSQWSLSTREPSTATKSTVSTLTQFLKPLTQNAKWMTTKSSILTLCLNLGNNLLISTCTIYYSSQFLLKQLLVIREFHSFTCMCTVHVLLMYM